MKFIKQNWFKIIIAIAILIIGMSIAWYFVIYIPNQQQKKQTVSNDIDSQQKCADRSAWFFKSEGYSDTTIVDTSSYFDHWNQSLNKCFILIESSSHFDSNSVGRTDTYDEILLDAFSAQTYGEINSSQVEGNFLATKTVNGCNINEDFVGASSTNCTTQAEFDNYADSLMNN
jgi:hypothetical protein